MQLEDPRIRYKQLQNERCSTESIPMQPLHGSPYHVYPSNNLPAMRAFQAGPVSNIHPGWQHMSSSPLLSSRGYLEMSPLPLTKLAATQTPRLGNLSRRSTIQETSFSNQIDTDAVVAKIQNMFPTANENHIRLLLRRYMKNIFPKADEMLLLDVLASADNNVQKASQTLISMGYAKRDFLAQKPSNLTGPNSGGIESESEAKQASQKIVPLRPKEYTHEEKEAIQQRFKEKYNQIAERIIIMALESVNYSEDRAIQILQIVQDEESDLQRVRNLAAQKASNIPLTVPDGIAQIDLPSTLEEAVAVSSGTDKYVRREASNGDELNPARKQQLQQQQQKDFKSILGRIAIMGPNNDLSCGPDESLLLADYVTWNGANPDISVGQRNLAVGTDTSLRSEHSYVAHGRNPELCKGPKTGLAKGSIYAQLSAAKGSKSANIKCN